MTFHILGKSCVLLVRICVLFTAIIEVASMRSTNTETKQHLDTHASSTGSDRIQQNSASYHSQWHEMFGQWLETTEMEGLVKEVENAKTKGASDRQIQAAFCFAESGYHTFEEFGLQREHIKINLKFALLMSLTLLPIFRSFSKFLSDFSSNGISIDSTCYSCLICIFYSRKKYL